MKKQNPADKVEQWSIDKLIPYARNSRTHSDAQIAQIAASIKEWGWTMPVLVDETGQIIAGHGRVLAARKLEMSQVPVTIARGWSEAQKRAYVIADNKLTLNAGWDEQMLAVEIADLTPQFDVNLIGFNDLEVAKLLQDSEGIDTSNSFDVAQSEWQDMPEFENGQPSFHKIIVHFDSDEMIEQFSKLLQQTITQKTRYIWFPEKERQDTESKRYISE